MRNFWRIAGLGLGAGGRTGCGHHKKVAVAPPPNELAPYVQPAYVAGTTASADGEDSDYTCTAGRGERGGP